LSEDISGNLIVNLTKILKKLYTGKHSMMMRNESRLWRASIKVEDLQRPSQLSRVVELAENLINLDLFKEFKFAAKVNRNSDQMTYMSDFELFKRVRCIDEGNISALGIESLIIDDLASFSLALSYG